jgi:hypothetical protein
MLSRKERKEMEELAAAGRLFGDPPDQPEQKYELFDASGICKRCRCRKELVDVSICWRCREELIDTWPKRFVRLLYGSAAGRRKEDHEERNQLWMKSRLDFEAQGYGPNEACRLVSKGMKPPFCGSWKSIWRVTHEMLKSNEKQHDDAMPKTSRRR